MNPAKTRIPAALSEVARSPLKLFGFTRASVVPNLSGYG